MDPAAYLEWVRQECGWIDVRGLVVGSGKAPRFPIQKLYIPLTTAPGTEDGKPRRKEAAEMRKPVPLEEALRSERLVIVGDPGSGKTTFLRRIAWELAGKKSGDNRFRLPAAGFPILIRIGDLEAHIRFCLGNGIRDSPSLKDSPAWLVHYLAQRSRDEGWGLEARFFERKLGEKATYLLLDGLDEAPNRTRRASMARNPVMLTALAVVHWNERRLPEQRAELYESILTWLARAREQREGREPADRCLTLLGHLALGMQNQAKGRLTQIARGRAAELIAPRFRQVPAEERYSRALRFLEEEEVDSGIVVSRGGEVRFWHLTFQEYLAARTLAGLGESEQREIVLKGRKLYRPEWREVMLLLGGVLHGQGAAKVDGLFAAVLDELGKDARLPEQARCAGLLGMMLEDLRPFDYEPEDPRYRKMLDAVQVVFDAKKSRRIDFQTRLEAAEALGRAGDPRLRDPRTDEDYWVRIPAGEFWMGAQQEDRNGPNYDPEANDNEQPPHRVKLDAFRIGRFPVTVEKFPRSYRFTIGERLSSRGLDLLLCLVEASYRDDKRELRQRVSAAGIKTRDGGDFW